MLHKDLKHKLDNTGRFKLLWGWWPSRQNKNFYYYHYWATFDNMTDAQELYELRVKIYWPNDKWEIVDLDPPPKI